MNSKNFQNTPKNIGIHPFFLDNYKIAERNFSLKKSVKVIHLIKQVDLKSKGINVNRINERELMLDLILDITGV